MISTYDLFDYAYYLTLAWKYRFFRGFFLSSPLPLLGYAPTASYAISISPNIFLSFCI